MVAGEPFYRDLFRFSGRRRRYSYNQLTLVLLLQSILVAIIGATFAPLGILLVWMYIIPAAAVYAIAGAQRCRDIGWNGWAVLMTILPAIGQLFALAILFIPGTRGPNRYGPDPLEATEEPTVAAS